MKRIVVLALLSLVSGLRAETADLEAVMEHLRPAKGAAEFQYSETRKLELMDRPWQGAGYLFSGSDGSLVKLQLAPERIVMAISRDSMLYFDPANGRRQSASLAAAGPMQAQAQAFKTVLQGRVEALQSLYDVAPSRDGKHWSLKLTAKPDHATDAVAAVEMSGDEDGANRTIRVKEANGDSAEYAISKTAEGNNVDATIQRLLKEAAGR